MLIKWSKSQFLFEIVEKTFSVKCKQIEHVYLLVRVIFGKSRDLQNEIIGEPTWLTKKAGFVTCCISIFGVFINGWMFTDGYIAAIRNLGLARFRFVLYTLSDGNPRR